MRRPLAKAAYKNLMKHIAYAAEDKRIQKSKRSNMRGNVAFIQNLHAEEILKNYGVFNIRVTGSSCLRPQELTP